MFDPKTPSKSTQNRTKATPRGDLFALKCAHLLFDRCLLRLGSQNASLWAPFLAPKWLQRIIKNRSAPKVAPRPPNFTPRRPKIVPRGSKRLPREPREAQKAPQEASKTPKRLSKNALETQKEPHQASIKQNDTPTEIKSKSTWPYILFATISVETTSL